MFKNKKIVLFLLVLPLVAVLVAPKVALADDDSDWVKNIPIIGGVVDFASDPGGWITDRFAEGAEFFFNDGLQNIKTTCLVHLPDSRGEHSQRDNAFQVPR